MRWACSTTRRFRSHSSSWQAAVLKPYLLQHDAAGGAGTGTVAGAGAVADVEVAGVVVAVAGAGTVAEVEVASRAAADFCAAAADFCAAAADFCAAVAAVAAVAVCFVARLCRLFIARCDVPAASFAVRALSCARSRTNSMALRYNSVIMGVFNFSTGVVIFVNKPTHFSAFFLSVELAAASLHCTTAVMTAIALARAVTLGSLFAAHMLTYLIILH